MSEINGSDFGKRRLVAKTSTLLYFVGIVALTCVLAYQRHLVVEARALLIYQTNQMLVAECNLHKDHPLVAMEILSKLQNMSIFYLEYRQIMFLTASGTVENYCKANAQKLDADTLGQLKEYSDEVLEHCNSCGWPGYYELIDQMILPKVFKTFVPAEPRGEVRRF